MSRPTATMTRLHAGVVALSLTCASGLALAGAADVIAATARQAADGSWSFEVTMRCDDRGPDYFCDRFEVLTPTARVVGVRRLLHDHTDEQPFTRDLQGVNVHDGLSRGVLIRGHHPRLRGRHAQTRAAGPGRELIDADHDASREDRQRSALRPILTT